MRLHLSGFLILAASLTGGCATAVVGTAASIGLYAVQDRTIGEGIDDAAASQRVKVRLMTVDNVAFREVDVEVAGRNVLLSGSVPTAEHRQAAETIARSTRIVDQVYNELAVGAPSTWTRSAQDEWISAQVRARLAASPAVRAINVNVETFHGSVYLMGIARTERELQRAAEIASVVGGVRRVVSFMQVRRPEIPYYAAVDAAPPTPDYREAAPGDGAGSY